MTSGGSVSQWINGLKAGDSAAAQRLWERYFDVLVRLARKKLGSQPRRAADEEDVALSALKSVCVGAKHGRFPQLVDRDSMWRLLVVITARKAFDQKAHERRHKRGGGRVFDQSGNPNANRTADDELDFQQIVSNEPTPEFVAMMTDQCRCLLECLDNDLRSICLWKLEGFTNDDIAERLGCVTRTVERKLDLIRKKWTATREAP